MSLFQDYRGSLRIVGTASSTNRVENASLAFASTGTLFLGFRFRWTARTTAATDFLWRFGTSASPGIGFKHRPGTPDFTVYTDSIVAGASTRVTSTIGDLTVNTNYAIVIAFAAAGLNLSNHPGASAGDKMIVYIYDLSTRTPAATVKTFNHADLGFALDAETGFEIRSQGGQTDYHMPVFWFADSSAGSKTAADYFGQRARDPRGMGITLAHNWTLDLYSTANVSTAGPTGAEAEALKDWAGSSDLLGVGPPAWSQTNVAQPLVAADDPAVGSATTTVRTANLRLARDSIAANPAGCRIVLCGDSFGRPDLDARLANALPRALISAGYDVMAVSWYARLGASTTVANCAVASMTNVTTEWYCSSALGTGSTFLTNPGGSTTRYGVPIGGILEAAATGVVTLGASNEVALWTIQSDINSLGQSWFGDGDRLWARVPLYVTATNQFSGTYRLTTAVGHYNHDTTTTNTWRQFYSDGATWAQILAGTGGDKVAEYLNCRANDIDLGTSGTSRTISVRIPTSTDLASGEKFLHCTPTVYKGTASNAPTLGKKKIHYSFMGDNSGNWVDFYTGGVATADGQKKGSDEQVRRWLEVTTLDPSMDVVFIKCIANESTSAANAQTHDEAFVTRMTSICSAAGITGRVRFLLLGQWMHEIGADTVGADRQHIADWNTAALAAAAANPSAVAAYSMLDYTGWYMGQSDTNAYAKWTQRGKGESVEAAADATVFGRMATGAWLAPDCLHGGTAAALKAVADAIVAAIDAAPAIGLSSSVGRSQLRARSLRI